ncbi:MAG: amidase family protein, partial [Sedimentisphaerales bacterium]|nr:amidase family protein [Sedimentisphaerales bacterium]
MKPVDTCNAFVPGEMMTVAPNEHVRNTISDDETCHARFPHPSPPPEREGTNESLYEFHVNGKGKLSSLTFAVKELYDVKGFVTGAGNPRWKDTHPVARTTAPAVEMLLNEGATLIGKTISDEMAFSLDGENAHYGTPLNPKCPDRIP